jgi:hypothetical protein
MQKKRLVALGVIAIAVATTAVLLLTSGKAKRATPASSYAFDSLYQTREAESRLGERVLQEEKDGERLRGSGEVRLQRTHCVVDPPPPAAQRMLCSLTTLTKEVRREITLTRYYRRKATISIDPASGALRFKITSPRPAARSLRLEDPLEKGAA